MRLHIIGLPWTETTSEFTTCAYTMKLLKAGKMFTEAGHEVFLYSGEENEAVCTEHIPVVKRAERIKWFGEHDQNSVWGHITWKVDEPCWRVMNYRAIAEIALRMEPNDLICLVAGQTQRPIIDALPELIATEPFVGYKGVIGGRVHCAFESHAWRHVVHGLKVAAGDMSYDDGRWYDTVIPNYFDTDDFTFNDQPDDYLLFVGRVSARKNPHVAALIANELDMKLIVAGPGVTHAEPGKIIGDGCELEGNVEYFGVAGIEERKALMGNARALIAPTQFLEPFGGVAVEAMLSGTPAVTSDWGAFTETVREGVSGYRFRTLAEGIDATRKAMTLDRQTIATYAERYSLEMVAPQYDRWFQQLDGLRNGGWSHVAPETVEIALQ